MYAVDITGIGDIRLAESQDSADALLSRKMYALTIGGIRERQVVRVDGV